MTANKYRTILAEIVCKFNTMELPKIMSCFADDVITNYNGIVVFGKEALADFLTKRYEDIGSYQLEKTIHLVEGDTIGVKAVARYTRKSTGEYVTTLIQEFLQFEENEIICWDYVGHNLLNSQLVVT